MFMQVPRVVESQQPQAPQAVRTSGSQYLLFQARKTCVHIYEAFQARSRCAIATPERTMPLLVTRVMKQSKLVLD